MEKNNQNVNFLSYSNNDNFEEYVLRVISAYRVGYKDKYSEMTLAIDPGNKCGLMVFLEDYYLNSHCCFEKRDLISKIKIYIQTFQFNNPELMNLTFKFGRGVLTITKDLVEHVYRIFDERKNMKILLIDEFKSSKIKIKYKTRERRISKDEASALILALRDGIEINQENYRTIFNQITSRKVKKEAFKQVDFKITNEKTKFSEEIAEIAKEILNGNLTLSKASQMVKALKNNRNEILDLERDY
ncbi:MAG: hypothetical protein EU532_02290 [Promethearchaeota archaeon]|nr:MAG: hypothetical protein EU532_02290 [Candidatus Lokiarchaeota archaeon]